MIISPLLCGSLIICCGIAGILFRRNMIMILISLQSAILGSVLAITSYDRGGVHGTDEVQLFALVIIIVLIAIVSIGYILFFNHGAQNQNSNIDHSKELRH